jgi:hypothetical protein
MWSSGVPHKGKPAIHRLNQVVVKTLQGHVQHAQVAVNELDQPHNQGSAHPGAHLTAVQRSHFLWEGNLTTTLIDEKRRFSRTNIHALQHYYRRRTHVSLDLNRSWKGG